MKNTKLIIIGTILIALTVVGFYFKNNVSKTVVNNNSIINSQTTENTKKDVTTICDTFPKEEIASITGLNITSTKVFTMGEDIENSNCGYYVDGRTVAAALSIGLYKGDASKQKERYQDPVVFKGWRVLTNNDITMDHFITYNEVQQLNDIFLIKGPNEFYRISLFALSALRGGQMIDLGVKIASKIR